jgi:Ca-activated chloride channel family protein
VLVAAPLAPAQDGAARPRRVTPPSTEAPGTKQADPDDVELRSDLVTLTVSVADSAGRPVGGLSPEDFALYEDGKPQKIEHFEPTGDPYSLLLVFDVSGSTESEIARMRAAAREFISALGPDDQLAMVSFARNIVVHGEMTNDRAALERQLRDVTPPRPANGERYDESTGTSFYDALFLASAESPLSAVKTTGRRAIVLFSDCVDSTSGYDFSSVVEPTERSGASVYVLLFDTKTFSDRMLTQGDDAGRRITFSRSQLDRFYDAFAPDSPDRGRAPGDYRDLERLEINGALYDLAREQAEKIATRTGGRVYPVGSLADLGGAYRAISAELLTRYSIGFYPTNTRHDGAWRKLHVEVPRRRGATVVAREGYWAPTE